MNENPDATDSLHTYEFDETFLNSYNASEFSSRMPPSESRKARFYQMIQMLKLSQGLKGATIEAGCFRGMASNLICRYLKMENPAFQGERHFLVDSFEGLSKPVESDGTYAAERFEDGAFTGTSIKHVKRTLAEFPKSRLIKGWIPDVLGTLPDQRYRFVHVDVDLFEPTRDCLDYFFPRLIRGGILVCDDYGPWPEGKWTGCGKAVREFCQTHQLPFAALHTGNAVMIKR